MRVKNRIFCSALFFLVGAAVAQGASAGVKGDDSLADHLRAPSTGLATPTEEPYFSPAELYEVFTQKYGLRGYIEIRSSISEPIDASGAYISFTKAFPDGLRADPELSCHIAQSRVPDEYLHSYGRHKNKRTSTAFCRYHRSSSLRSCSLVFPTVGKYQRMKLKHPGVDREELVQEYGADWKEVRSLCAFPSDFEAGVDRFYADFVLARKQFLAQRENIRQQQISVEIQRAEKRAAEFRAQIDEEERAFALRPSAKALVGYFEAKGIGMSYFFHADGRVDLYTKGSKATLAYRREGDAIHMIPDAPAGGSIWRLIDPDTIESSQWGKIIRTRNVSNML